MADYYRVKNQNIFNPPANTSLGNTTNQFTSVVVQNNLVLGNVTVTSSTIIVPRVSSITYPGDDTAADTAGGQTITLTGSGFVAGASVLINGSAVSVVSVVSSTSITFTSPAISTGSYVLYVINPDGSTAIFVPGIQYSGTPAWTTAAGSLGSVYETASFSQTVAATGDAPVTYSIFSGTIPPGATFNSNGAMTGTSGLLSSPTTYTFTVRATDAQNQDTNRSFSLTITPDVVTWSSPANNTTYALSANVAMANVTLSATSAVNSAIVYSANSLPTGVSLTGAVISGTPTVIANTSSLLTATANTTSESSSRTINWVVSLANDPFFKYNSLLIPGANTTFVDDASTNNFGVTIFGDTKPNNNNPYTPGYYSNFFPNLPTGTSGFFVPDNDGFTFGSGAFTVEAYINMTASRTGGTSAGVIYGQSANIGNNANRSHALQIFNTSLTFYFVTDGVTDQTINWSYTFNLNTWYHVAVARSGNTIYGFVNGVLISGQSFNVTISNSSAALAVGLFGRYSIDDGYTGLTFPGYISNLRIVKGTALYTSTFTPSTTPLTAVSGTALLTCQSNRFIDNSSNNATCTVNGTTSINSFNPFIPNSSYSTYGSGYFDGTGDYLTFGTSVNLPLGTSDFTIEAWVYLNSGSTYQYVLGTTGNGGMQVGLNVPISGTPTIAVATANGSWILNFGASILIRTATWTHIAVTRSGSTNRAFINGVQLGSNITDSTSWTFPNNNLQIGATLGAEAFGGYMADVRIVKGTAVYTTAFTPPATPLTAIANTSLLTLQNNQSVNNSTFLDNSTNNFLVTRAGNTTQGTFSPYGGNWSNYFDGTGDYLSLPSNAAFDFGTGDLTIECWIYVSSISTSYQSVFQFGDAAPTTGFHFLVNTNTICLRTNNSQPLTTSGTILANTWNHIAITRASSTTKIFINGTTSGGTYNWTASLSSGTARLIGSDTYSNPFTGYISNARVVKGTAVYTSNFTPSTTPLVPITNTSLLTCQSNRLIDNSINNFTITKNGDVSVQRFSPFNPASVTPASYSGYFDGTGDYLSAGSNLAFAVGTGDFTFQVCVYPTAYTSPVGAIFDTGSSVASGRFCVVLYANGILKVDSNASLLSSSSALPLNQWTFISIIRSSGTMTMYFNGTSVASASVTSNFNETQGIIGKTVDNYYFQGYISNFRLVKGTALENTVPTTPLTAISGTSLLTLQSTTFVDNSTNNFTITAFGNSQPTIQNPFGYTSATTNGYTVSTIGGSGYFDGTGDYLSVPDNAAFNFTGNFTIECWVYPTSHPATVYLISQASSTDYAPVLLYLSNGRPGIAVSTTGNTWIINGYIATALTLNAWSHMAVVRSGNKWSIYVNGVENVLAASTSGTPYNSTDPLGIGGEAVGSLTYPYIGYLSDVRIINNIALYTSNFVPPAQPLTAIQNTSLLLNMTSAGIYDASMMNNMETVGDAKLSHAVSKFGGTSTYFDGSGDYLQIAASDTLNFGTGDFTIECWVYSETISTNYPSFISSITGWSAGASGHRFDNVGYANKFWFGLNGSGGAASGDPFMVSTNTFNHNQWYHYALTRSGNTWRMFVDGNLETTQTYSGSYNAALGGMRLGYSTWDGAQGWWKGYLDDLRITKGYARYTANFTAPTAAFFIY